MPGCKDVERSGVFAVFLLLRRGGALLIKGVAMQQRVILLFVLFVVLAAFYASVSRQSVPVITQKQRAQTELFDEMDANALNRTDTDAQASGG